MPRYPGRKQAPAEPKRLLISIGEAALELGGVSKPTVYALVNRGELQKVKIGSRGFITTASLTAYVERLTKAATA